MATIPTKTVLEEEAHAIHGVDFSGTPNISELYKKLNALDRHALCLSGGGIRSASFALGIIEALAVHPRLGDGAPIAKAENSFLSQFHYLSTVSGGGYIGSWLSTWISRVGFASVKTCPAGNGAIRSVWKDLVGREQPDAEPRAISWLRENSNYLTPKLGITSADTWTAIALYLRNLLLNWLILLPALCAVIIFLKGSAALTMWFARLPEDDAIPAVVASSIGIVTLFIALCFTCRHRPSRGGNAGTQREYLSRGLFPVIVSGLALSWFLVSGFAEVQLSGTPRIISHVVELVGLDSQWVKSHPQLAIIVTWALGGAFVYAVSWPIAAQASQDWKRDLGAWTFSGVIYAALVGAGVYWYFNVGEVNTFLGLEAASVPVLAVIVIGVPWVLLSLLIAETIFVALTSYQPNSDADREWLGRAAGWMLAVSIIWPIFTYLMLFGSDLVHNLSHAITIKLTSIGGVSGLVTLLLGKSGFSPSLGSRERSVRSVSINLILGISTPIFAGVLVLVISALLERVLLGHSLIAKSELMTFHEDVSAARSRDSWLLIVGLFATAFIGIVSSACININRFSLHALYRNRLIRAFLGASNPKRDPNKFTQFDPNDNLPMGELWPRSPNKIPRSLNRADWQPLHIINIALNIVSSDRLAWQERKAESFTVSPLHSGSACKDGYRSSDMYGGKISVGTAMAISGAAASPNMGYHSSPGVSLLLALFNVRLGWWLGNPGKEGDKTFPYEGPKTAAMPFLKEMFGLTTDDQPYVYLSDGGHFENLGLYEMVRRRCRFIIVSDGGCDRDFAFEDLGNAVRKIEIDLGVSIQFKNLEALKTLSGNGTAVGKGVPYYATADIDYPAVDGGGSKGKILYVKAAYHGTESAGIRSYASVHPNFPHETTANQWFSESQFESYRSLGFEITDGLLTEAEQRLTAAKPKAAIPLLCDVFDYL